MDKLVDRVERLSLGALKSGSGRRQNFLPVREAIEIQKHDDRKRSSLTRFRGESEVMGQEQMAKPPSAAHLAVRIRAVLGAVRARDGDALRGELINLASYAEVWAEQLGRNPRVVQGLTPRNGDLDPPDEDALRELMERV